MPPPDEHTQYFSLEERVKFLPNFRYQVYLNNTQCVDEINANKRLFFQALYRRHTDPPVRFVNYTHDLMAQLEEKPQTLLAEEEIDEYIAQFSKQGLRGPTNWYRTTELNYKEDQQAKLTKEVNIPTLFVAANYDPALPPTPRLLENTYKYVEKLDVKFVDASHFIMAEAYGEVNGIIERWLNPHRSGL